MSRDSSPRGIYEAKYVITAERYRSQAEPKPSWIESMQYAALQIGVRVLLSREKSKIAVQTRSVSYVTDFEARSKRVTI